MGALITLGGGASTIRADVGYCRPTLGAGAGVGDSWMLGGPPDGMLKMERRLSTASSWEWQLSGDLSAPTAMVRDRRQWMILSVVLIVGTDRVGC